MLRYAVPQEGCGVDLRAASKEGRLPIDVAAVDEIRQAIVGATSHTYKRPRLEGMY